MDENGAAKLPNLDHFSYRDADRVYEPAEDTYLLCDALLQDIENVMSINPTIIAEVGSGSGCVITYFTNLLRNAKGRKVLAFATDLNIDALHMTQLTANNNNVRLICELDDRLMRLFTQAKVECVRTCFLAALEGRLHQSIDILIFNPPYVPSELEELGSSGIEAAWAGGKDGREVIDQFLPKLPVRS